jgi:hypothetical protein
MEASLLIPGSFLTLYAVVRVWRLLVRAVGGGLRPSRI